MSGPDLYEQVPVSLIKRLVWRSRSTATPYDAAVHAYLERNP